MRAFRVSVMLSAAALVVACGGRASEEGAAADSEPAAEAPAAETQAGGAENQNPAVRPMAQTLLVEFVRPYTDEDIEWLEGYGCELVSELSETSVTVTLASTGGSEWTSDERIAKVTPMMR